jgi:hypothetical protein
MKSAAEGINRVKEVEDVKGEGRTNLEFMARASRPLPRAENVRKWENYVVKQGKAKIKN